MLGHGATGQFAIGQVGAGAAETITVDKWFEALSLPVRFLPGLRAGMQQSVALPGPYPFVPFSWFEELSKPAVLIKAGLLPSEQQFFTLNPLPRVSYAWFEGLSEPQRFPPALLAALQQFFAADTAVIPTSKLLEWFAALSEPPRFRPGLLLALQQFLAHPPQLRPSPTTTGILNALETKDSFLGAAREWNPIISGEIGIIEKKFTGAEIGISVPTIAGSRVAITIR